jgi:hypothetical protein
MAGQICNGNRTMPMTISDVVCRSDTVTLANPKRTSPDPARIPPEVVTGAKPRAGRQRQGIPKAADL